jgi:hypothetical protein
VGKQVCKESVPRVANTFSHNSANHFSFVRYKGSEERISDEWIKIVRIKTCLFLGVEQDMYYEFKKFLQTDRPH